jgi:Protein of unknown function (DUF669)
MTYFDDAADDVFDPPDGVYTVTIAEGEAFETNDGREFCKLVLRGIEGPAKGRTFDHFMTLSHPDAKRISGDALRLYGVDLAAVADLEDLSAHAAGLVGTEAEVGVSHNKKGYLNVKVYSATPAGGERGPAADVTDVAAPADPRAEFGF